MTTNADRQVMSNGVLVSNTVDEAAGTSTWVWDAPDPMATYLATLQIGKYTIQRTTTASGIPIINGIRPDQLTEQAQTRLNNIGPILDFFGSKFGTYPFVATRRDRRPHDRRLPDGAADAAHLHERERPLARSRTSSRTSGSATTSPSSACATSG